MTERAIITGATSMLGVATIEAFLRQDVPVVAVIRPDTGKRNRLPDSTLLYIVECDIQDYLQLPGLIGGRGGIFYHFAWVGTGPDRNSDYHRQSQNIRYTINAVLAAHELGASAFIGAGSQAEYGIVEQMPTKPETPAYPNTPYGICKLAAGRMALSLGEQLGIKTIWARVFSVYGKYDKPTSMISQTLRKMRDNEPTAFTKAEHVWDYLFSEDAGNAFFLLGLHGKDQATYCIASGDCRPLIEYLKVIEDLMQPSHPLGIGRITQERRVYNLCADISSLIEDTGFKPGCNFEDGIRFIVKEL